MIGTDKYSYLSRLKDIDPTAKLALTASSVVVCLATDSLLTNLFTILFFCLFTAYKGGTPIMAFIKLMCMPFFFLLIGVITILIGRFQPSEPMFLGMQVGGWVYGISKASLQFGLHLILRAMGCVASVYFTVLTTPIPDLLLALRRLHMPQLLLELMELIYRFIFVLYETAERIHIAQASRLGYQGLRRSYHSMGDLLSMVFLKAYRKSDKIYTALESRGYQGELRTVSRQYRTGAPIYGLCVVLTVLQLGLFAAERGLAC